MAPRLHLVGRGRLGTSKPPTRASVKRKRAVLDGGGQGWLSRRTGATKKRRRAHDGFPMEGFPCHEGRHSSFRRTFSSCSPYI